MRVGVDIGGTFTDLVARTDDGLRVRKVPSTPDDPARAIADALEPFDAVPELLHGTTVATNAVLTRSGARLAFLCTDGFRHLLHLARQDRPSLYDLRALPSEPLVTRDRCVGVPERLSASGEVLRPLEEAGLRAALEALRGEVDGVAVALLHAYADPAHEVRVAELVREALPGVPVSLSSHVLPEFREYERASTTALNAYVQPVMSSYLGRIADIAHGARIGVMWSGGGVRGLDGTVERPVQTLLSGPAAGVLAAAWIADRCGTGDVVTLDMGGTSADVALVEGGVPLVAEESSLDGLPFRTPCLDVISVGAGGGSIGWIDEGGALHVGPRSAGAVPGPACYGRGGTDATVSDAQAVLGLLGTSLAGGALTLDMDAARSAVDRLAAAAHLDVEATAHGILRVVRATMSRAIRAVSVERGKDVRRYSLVAFGGAGPLHATALAQELGIGRVIVPPSPGALAALGLLVASRRADASVSRPMSAVAAHDGNLRQTLSELVARITDELEAEAVGRDDVRIGVAVDCRYVGQSHELRIDVAGDDGFASVVAAFHDAHRDRYGFDRRDADVEAVTFRAWGLGPPGELELPAPPASGDPVPTERRRVGDVDVAVYERRDLPEGFRVDGPALLDEPDSTTWIDPGWSASVHPSGALLVEAR
jgi:N-methylhydantoinase A